MEQIYTDFSMIRYIYGESDIPERFEMEYALENDPKLFKSFSAWFRAYKSLPKVLFRPSAKVRDNVLCFSRSF